MQSLRLTLSATALGLVVASSTAAQQYTVDFDTLPGGAVVAGQEPSADFSAAPGFEIQAFGYNLGTSLPNYICTAPAGSSITCMDPVYVSFPVPVENVTFFAVGTNKTTRVATAKVFVNNVLTASVDITGSGNPLVPVFVDLSAYKAVTRIELVDIDDPLGLGWDDFSYMVDPAPGFNPPTPCQQAVVAYVNQPATFMVDASDALGIDILTLDVQGLPSGANFSPQLPMAGNPVASQFTWIPSAADVGTHSLFFTATDSSGQTATCTVNVEVNCNGDDSHYGTGLAGSGGFEPVLSASCPTIGELIFIDASQAIGGSCGCLLLGDTQLSVPLYGGTLLANPQIVTTHMTSGTKGVPGAGSANLSFMVPNDPSLVGKSFFLQAGYVDPGAPQRVAMTDGLEIQIGN